MGRVTAKSHSMNRFNCRIFLVFLCCAAIIVDEAFSQDPLVIARHDNGVLSWSNQLPVSCFAVEWASSPVGKWQCDWDALSAIPPQQGVVTVGVPQYFRLRSYAVTTGFPVGTRIMLYTSGGTTTAHTNLQEAYDMASPNDTIYMLPGVYHMGSFTIEKSNLTFVGTAPPVYDIASSNFTQGVIWDTGTRINNTPGLTFRNIGFINSSGGDPFLTGGLSSDTRLLYMDNCSFGGTMNNPHNIEVIGRGVRLDNCKSYNGGHNFAFKARDLTLNNIYSYNGRLNGIILKGSDDVGDMDGADLNNITIEGPDNVYTAHGVHIEGFSAGSAARNIRINGLRTKNVNMAVYIWPHPGSIVRDIIVSDAVSYDTYTGYGDYLLQPGATNVTFLGCRSYNPKGMSFVLFGSAMESSNIRVMDCYSSKPSDSQFAGPFALKHINGVFR